jgi:hypothetical protein
MLDRIVSVLVIGSAGDAVALAESPLMDVAWCRDTRDAAGLNWCAAFDFVVMPLGSRARVVLDAPSAGWASAACGTDAGAVLGAIARLLKQRRDAQSNAEVRRFIASARAEVEARAAHA